jgi:hypoxanthine phosphoribosyltransferase
MKKATVRKPVAPKSPPRPTVAAEVPVVARLSPRVPTGHRATIGGVVASPAQIRRRIHELGRQIQQDFGNREWVMVAVLSGSVLFVADLIREIEGPVKLDFVGVSSYGDGTQSGELVYTKELKLDVAGRDVLVVDDILDTGRTLSAVIGRMKALGARRVRSCVLLDKPSRRVVKQRVEYVGFRIPDWFVIGYGLDYAERYRNLPFIGVLRPEAVK